MRWIPVTERLPNKQDDYLVTIPLDNNSTYVDVLHFHKGKFYDTDSEWGDIEYDDVLAWMPLPEPYKSDRKTEPTISKMEQVEDEPQTPYDNCQSCLHWVYDGYWYCECNECRYEPKDEPQTDCAWR